MKFLIFSDFHYDPEVFMRGSEEDLVIIQNKALQVGAEFMIHAGDLCHGPAQAPDFVRRYNEFEIPSYHCLGNHDTDETSYEETLKQYQMPDGHYYFDRGGYRFIICDPNYYLMDGAYIHYSLRNYYPHRELRDYMPPEQLKWLENTISASTFPCVLISHQSFEREADGVKNMAEVQRIIRQANERKPNSVILCVNGHYHRDHIRILDNVCYLDLNSASFDFLPNAHTCYPRELCEKHRELWHTLTYEDPVYAVITLEGTEITIEGVESKMLFGIQCKDTGNPLCDPAGRISSPGVQSARISLGRLEKRENGE